MKLHTINNYMPRETTSVAVQVNHLVQNQFTFLHLISINKSHNNITIALIS